MEASSYWSSYLIQMLAVQFAIAYARPELVADYQSKANEYLDLHFAAIDKHLENLEAFRNG